MVYGYDGVRGVTVPCPVICSNLVFQYHQDVELTFYYIDRQTQHTLTNIVPYLPSSSEPFQVSIWSDSDDTYVLQSQELLTTPAFDTINYPKTTVIKF